MLKDKQKDKYIEIRKAELTADSEKMKDQYIASLELFLNDTLAHFDKEGTENEDRDDFYCEYFGLMHKDALSLIEKLETTNSEGKGEKQ